jgi:hypothetical protein
MFCVVKMYLCILSILLVLPCYSETPPEEPRFCALSANATSFSCNEYLYARSIYNRSPIIVVPIILFVVSFIILLLPCLARHGVCSCIGTDRKDDEGRHGTKKHAFWIILALAIFVGGCACGFVAHTRSAETVANTKEYLEQQMNNILSIQNNITNTLDDAQVDIPQNDSEVISNGFGEVSDYVGKITAVQEKVSPYENYFVYSIPIWIIAIGIFALFFAYTGKGLFFYLTGFLTWWIVLAASAFLFGLLLFNVVSSDICRELDYDPGVLDLLQQAAQDAYSKLTDALANVTNQIVSDTCNLVSEYCQSQPTLCPCSASTFQDLPSKTIRDGTNVRNVIQCATLCQDENLKNLSVNIVKAVYTYDIIQDLENDVENEINGLTSPETISTIGELVCDNDYVGVPLFVGCLLLLAASALVSLSLLAMDRAVWCFSSSIGHDEEYRLY